MSDNPDASLIAEAQPSEPTLSEALAIAQRLHRFGQLDGALELYGRIVEVAPE